LNGLLVCDTRVVILTVWVAHWQLDEDRWVVAVGDEISFWLTFEESERWPGPAEQSHVIRGVARPLPRWPGAELGRHPVQLEVGGVALYWDAPGPVAGVVEVAGSVSSNTVDTPDGFPMARGVARRVRMEWREFVHDGQRRWSYADGEARYEQVEASYFPIQEAETGDPDVPPGARKTQWTGVLVDLEITQLAQA
jgi:hypothetical protein